MRRSVRFWTELLPRDGELDALTNGGCQIKDFARCFAKLG